ncbi:MAG: prolyl oligopeptidase family serine peptidase [Actinomycetota bacterium]
MAPIPLELVTSGRDLSEPRLDPSGRYVAFVRRSGGDAAIAVVDLDGDRVERDFTFGPAPRPGRGLGGGCFAWMPAASSAGDAIPDFVYVADDGELWWQGGAQLRQLTHARREMRAPSTAMPATTPAAVGADDPQRGRRSPIVAVAVDEAEIWVVDVVDGSSRRVDDGRHEFCFDPAISPDGRMVAWQAWSPPDMPWDGSVRVEADLRTGEVVEHPRAGGAVQQPRFTSSGERCEIHDASGWLNVDVAGRAVAHEPVEHAGPTWGMGNRSYAISPHGIRVAIARNHRGIGDLAVVEIETGRITVLDSGIHGALDWQSDRIAAVRSDASRPPSIVVHDLADESVVTVARADVVGWDAVELPEPDPVIALSADGATLHARRYTAGAGRMICWVHGGPTDQWPVEWRPRIAYWWSRGWDVLVVDPRGTTGHGREYQQALHGRWGRLDVDDTAAILGAAQRSGWASATSTVVMGGSSGGLTVLGVLADHGHLVAGGVASYPVSDLRALAEATHRFEAHYTDTLVAPLDGHPDHEARFTELSPLHRAERIAAPLLLSHGSDDPVVPAAQSIALAERIRTAGGDVDLVIYDGEGHGYRDPAHVADDYARTEAFLDRVCPPADHAG